MPKGNRAGRQKPLESYPDASRKLRGSRWCRGLRGWWYESRWRGFPAASRQRDSLKDASAHIQDRLWQGRINPVGQMKGDTKSIGHLQAESSGE